VPRNRPSESDFIPTLFPYNFLISPTCGFAFGQERVFMSLTRLASKGLIPLETD